jgi:hypothetical protein
MDGVALSASLISAYSRSALPPRKVPLDSAGIRAYHSPVNMTSVVGVPAYMLPGVPVVQPPHLEGDPSLATEILPGPPSLATVQQAAYKRPAASVSYLPTSDPGSTYTGWTPPGVSAIPPVAADEPRRKRARTDKA